jgi:hypothetical protein
MSKQFERTVRGEWKKSGGDDESDQAADLLELRAAA